MQPFQLSEQLEQLIQDCGTARDGLQLRDEIQQLMKALYEQIQRFNRESTNLTNVANPKDVSGGRGSGSGKETEKRRVEALERKSLKTLALLACRKETKRRMGRGKGV